MDALLRTSLKSLPLLGVGKVRDNYAVGDDKLLMVTTDRLSAFDVVMSEPIPGKGCVLNTLVMLRDGTSAIIAPEGYFDPSRLNAPDAVLDVVEEVE